MGARAVWAVPAAFVSMMIVGGLLGMGGIALPFVEIMIVASVFVFAGFVVARVKMPIWSGLAIVGLFALAHGHAHGAEMPALVNMWVYGAGFVAATSLIHALGAIAAQMLMKMKTVWV